MAAAATSPAPPPPSPSSPSPTLQPFAWLYSDSAAAKQHVHMKSSAVVIVLACLTILLFLSLVYFCARLARRLRGMGGRAVDPSDCPEKPDEAKSVAVPSSALAWAKEEGECSICLGVVVVGEKVGALRPCGHEFHPDCVDEWVKARPSCPLCRVGLVALPTDPATLV